MMGSMIFELEFLFYFVTMSDILDYPSEIHFSHSLCLSLGFVQVAGFFRF